MNPEQITARPPVAAPAAKRETYLDTLRVYLTMLVIFHHAAVTYGAPGGWYYSEPVGGLVPGLLLTVFVSTNQSFFMGLFFFLSAYFILPSLARKSTLKFMLDRLKRLGIPLIVYSFLLTPAILTVVHWGDGVDFVGYAFHREQWIQVGVLWFTLALLIFSALYCVLYATGTVKKQSLRLPGDWQIAAFAIGLGIISFIIRIYFPVGWTLQPFGFQPGHFTQYIALFTLGIVAYRNQWLEALTYARGRKWLFVALGVLLIGFPGMYSLKIILKSDLDAFLGGLTIESFASAVWEQFMGISIILALLGMGKSVWTRQGGLLKAMSRSAYAVYIIHPLVLVTASVVLKDFALPSLVKFVLAGGSAVLLSFVAGAVLVRIPGVKEVV